MSGTTNKKRSASTTTSASTRVTVQATRPRGPVKNSTATVSFLPTKRGELASSSVDSHRQCFHSVAFAADIELVGMAAEEPRCYRQTNTQQQQRRQPPPSTQNLWSFLLQQAPQPLPLRRQIERRESQEVLPGAQHVSGMVSVVDVPRLVQQVGNDNDDDQPQQPLEQDGEPAAIAYEVTENEEETDLLPNAHPTELYQNSKQHWRRKLILSLSLEIAVCLLVVGVTVLALVNRKRKTTKHQTANQHRHHHHSQQFSPVDTIMDSVAQQNPISFQHLLPRYTQMAMKNPKSPQSMAYEWLISNAYNNTNHNQQLPEWRLIQSYALATLYFSTNGNFWVNNHAWLDWEIHECEWEQSDFSPEGPGPPCDDLGHFTSLSFHANKLDGTIPPEIALLGTSLQLLRFSTNFELRGAIPSTIGWLTKLSTLDLSGLSGTIPTEIGLLQNVEWLTFGPGQFSGSIPSELGVLSGLTTFGLMEIPSLTGSLPNRIFHLSALKQLGIRYCPQLETGTILHDIINNLPQLEMLTLHDSGSQSGDTIPRTICNLSALQGLNLMDWKIKGPIPVEVWELQNLTALNLKGNSISGTLTPAVSQLTRLEALYLAHNPLSGSVPTEIGLLSNLEQIQLQDTLVSGQLPTELLALRNLTRLTVTNTPLFGTVPRGLCNKLWQVKSCYWGSKKCYEQSNANQTVCHNTSLCGCDCGACHDE